MKITCIRKKKKLQDIAKICNHVSILKTKKLKEITRIFQNVYTKPKIYSDF